MVRVTSLALLASTPFCTVVGGVVVVEDPSFPPISTPPSSHSRTSSLHYQAVRPCQLRPSPSSQARTWCFLPRSHPSSRQSLNDNVMSCPQPGDFGQNMIYKARLLTSLFSSSTALSSLLSTTTTTLTTTQRFTATTKIKMVSTTTFLSCSPSLWLSSLASASFLAFLAFPRLPPPSPPSLPPLHPALAYTPVRPVPAAPRLLLPLQQGLHRCGPAHGHPRARCRLPP